MADDIRPSDYITFRELVEREEKMRREMKAHTSEAVGNVERDMTSRFNIFGHEVAKQFVEEREKLARVASPSPEAEPQKLRQQVTEMASGRHGWALALFGIGLIMLSLAILAHAPFMKNWSPL